MPNGEFEFTPEIGEEFYQRLAQRVRGRGEAAVGRARGEALARGLAGDPFERGGVAAARAGTREELADLDAELAYRLAGLRREERLGREAREWRGEEAEKERGFRERMADVAWGRQIKMGEMERGEAARARRARLWGDVIGGVAGAGGMALGGWLGGLGGAGARVVGGAAGRTVGRTLAMPYLE